MGYGFSEDEFSNTPIVMVGADLSISNSTKIITENWITGYDHFYSFGVRIFNDDLAGELGLFTDKEVLSNRNYINLFPWLGFTYNFGRGR